MSTKTTAKNQVLSDEKFSICDLTKNNTSEILQKVEYQIPLFLQGYTDLFTKYVHTFNNYFGSCRISEKQFFDKVGIDHTIMKEIANFWDFGKSLAIIQIETCSKFVLDYIDFGISTIDSLDKAGSSSLDHYLKAVSYLGNEDVTH